MTATTFDNTTTLSGPTGVASSGAELPPLPRCFSAG